MNLEDRTKKRSFNIFSRVFIWISFSKNSGNKVWRRVFKILIFRQSWLFLWGEFRSKTRLEFLKISDAALAFSTKTSTEKVKKNTRENKFSYRNFVRWTDGSGIIKDNSDEMSKFYLVKPFYLIWKKRSKISLEILHWNF